MKKKICIEYQHQNCWYRPFLLSTISLYKDILFCIHIIQGRHFRFLISLTNLKNDKYNFKRTFNTLTYKSTACLSLTY